MESLEAVFGQPGGIAIAVSTCLILLSLLASAAQKSPQPFQRVGYRTEFFSKFRASLRSPGNMHLWIDEGYKKFSKKNIPFIFQDLILGPTLVIPPTQIKYLHTRPNSEVDFAETQARKVQLPYTIVDNDLTPAGNVVDIVRKHMTRKLQPITECMANEMEHAFDDYWGTSTGEWKSVSLNESILKVISRAANRMLVGDPLCRDESFLETSRQFFMSILITGSLLNLIPSALRWALAPLFVIRLKWLRSSCLRTCMPLVKERLEQSRRKREDAAFDWEPPEDGLQWIIDESYQALHREPTALNPERVALRYLMVAMMIVPSVSIVLFNAMLDLYSAAPAEKYAEQIREECQSVLTSIGGEWTRDGVNLLYRLDSALRESMRFSSFGSALMLRTVIAPKGITLDSGVNVPKGTLFSVPLDNVHHDPDHYSEPDRYNAFRFSEPFEKPRDLPNPNTSRENRVETIEQKRKLTTTIDDRFLMWAYGVHACPGRFFVTHVMKLMLAIVVMHYDIEPLAEKPKMQKMGGFTLPDSKIMVRIRRRTLEG